jgi:hypothetical protein
VQTWPAPDVSHILRTQAGAPSLRACEADLRRPVDQGVLDRVTGWLTIRAGTDNGETAPPSTADPATA